MSATKYGKSRYLSAQQIPLTAALAKGVKTFSELAEGLLPSAIAASAMAP